MRCRSAPSPAVLRRAHCRPPAHPPGGLLPQDLAIDAVQTVAVELGNGQREIDVKKYAKVEKIPGGVPWGV